MASHPYVRHVVLMPNLREIRRHIQSVRGIAKITKAMELVAAAQSHRLQARVDRSRAFAVKSWEVLNRLTSTAEPQLRRDPIICGYPKVRRIGMLLITSNRGLVGAYNHNIIRLASRYIQTHDVPVELITIGKIGRNRMLRQGYPIHADCGHLDDHADIMEMSPVARMLQDGFRERVFDEVVIASTRFRPIARLEPAIRPLLPLSPSMAVDSREYIYEPNPHELFISLLPHVIRFQIYQAFLEALVAENTSRMMTMHSAAKNGEDLIDRLIIGYNKARQQAITAELLDIIGGSAGLVG